MAYAIARDYYFPGADRDDVRQEALIGVMEAIRSHDPQRGPLKPFVALVVKKRLQECVTFARRGKHEMLTRAVRYGTDPHLTEGKREPIPLVELVEDPRWQPEEVLRRKNEMRALLRAWSALTPLERRALLHPATGAPYRGDKVIDNAIQRGREKLRRAA